MFLHGGIDSQNEMVSTIYRITNESIIENVTSSFFGSSLPFKSNHNAAVVFINDVPIAYLFGGRSAKLDITADMIAINLMTNVVSNIWETETSNISSSEWGGFASVGSCMVSIRDKLVIFGGKKYFPQGDVILFTVYCYNS